MNNNEKHRSCILTTESRIDNKPEASCSPGKALHIECTIFFNTSFSFSVELSDSFILLYNLEKIEDIILLAININANKCQFL